MSLHFEGERRLALPVGEVWPKLRDARFLVTCIPDATIAGEPTVDRAECVVKPNLTFVRGNLDVVVEMLEATEPRGLTVGILSKGIGSSSDVRAWLEFASEGEGTHIRWQADVLQLGGLLKMVPAGLIRGAANKAIDDLWNGIERRLA
jgi:carbon monoxide dehydrogenase subunit G